MTPAQEQKAMEARQRQITEGKLVQRGKWWLSPEDAEAFDRKEAKVASDDCWTGF